MSKKIIFIGSPARSGSTLLDMIIGNDEKGFSLGEPINQFWPWRVQDFNSRCACGYKNCSVRKELEAQSKESLYPYLLEEKGYDFVVDSSKNYIWMLDGVKIAKQKGYEVYILLVYKDPMDLAYSKFKRNDSIDDMYNYYKYFDKVFETKLPFITISLSNFLENIETNLPKLCDYLGIEYYEGKEKFWTAEQHHFFGSMSVRKTKHSDNPKIKKNINYSQEFETVMPALSKQIEQNEEVQTVLKKLKERDITLHDELSCPTKDLPYKYRLKYYLIKLYRTTIQRLFPSKYDAGEFPVFD